MITFVIVALLTEAPPIRIAETADSAMSEQGHIQLNEAEALFIDKNADCRQPG